MDVSATHPGLERPRSIDGPRLLIHIFIHPHSQQTQDTVVVAGSCCVGRGAAPSDMLVVYVNKQAGIEIDFFELCTTIKNCVLRLQSACIGQCKRRKKKELRKSKKREIGIGIIDVDIDGAMGHPALDAQTPLARCWVLWGWADAQRRSITSIAPRFG